MNPIFVLLVIVGIVALWFLLSFMYKPIGKIFDRVWKDSVNEIKGTNEKNTKKESENER